MTISKGFRAVFCCSSAGSTRASGSCLVSSDFSPAAAAAVDSRDEKRIASVERMSAAVLLFAMPASAVTSSAAGQRR